MEAPGARWMREMKALEAAILERLEQAADSIRPPPARVSDSTGLWGGRTKAAALHAAVRQLDEWLGTLDRQYALGDVRGFWMLRLF